MSFSWPMLLNWWPLLIEGVLTTLKAFGVSVILSLFVGIFVAFIVSSNIRVVRRIFEAYISIFRNTPLLVQMYFLFYGLPFIGFNVSPFICGVLGITLNEGAFMAEIIRGSIHGILKEDWEAAESLGLSWFQTMRYVVIPQALRDAIPALIGQASIVVKDTSLFTLIMVPELTSAAGRIYSTTFNSGGYFVAATLYIAAYWVLDLCSGKIEKRIRVRR